MGFKKGEGGRKPGSKNKLTLARLQMREEALRRLNEDLPADAFDGDAIAFFQRIYRDPNFDPQLRLDAAAKIAAFERKDSTEDKPQYVAVMPMPVKNLDEWKALYMEAKPDASPEDVAWHEKIAKVSITNKNGDGPKAGLPWIDDDKKDSSQ